MCYICSAGSRWFIIRFSSLELSFDVVVVVIGKASNYLQNASIILQTTALHQI